MNGSLSGNIIVLMENCNKTLESIYDMTEYNEFNDIEAIKEEK